MELKPIKIAEFLIPGVVFISYIVVLSAAFGCAIFCIGSHFGRLSSPYP